MRNLILFALGAFVVPACSDKDAGDDSQQTSDDRPPKIALSVDSLVFESLAVGDDAQKSFTIQNLGHNDLDLTGMTIAPPFATTFTSLVTIAPGGAHSVTVVFSPSDPGVYEETLTIASNDPDFPASVVQCSGDTVSDGDGDGFDSPIDCDDADPDVNPGADEIWYNGVDDDCACTNPRCNDFDEDADGYDNEDYNSDPETGRDCADQNPSFHPGAADAWYDGYDSNCDDALDYDQDGDGFSSAEHTDSGTDCDDLNPEVHPYDKSYGVEDYNGLDDECDGYPDWEILGTNAEWTFNGVAADDRFGYGLTTGLIDADYANEVIAGAPGYSTGGSVSIYTGAELLTGTDLEGADILLTGASGDDLGYEVAWLSDFGGGGSHLVVGGPGYSADKGYAAVLDSDLLVGGGTLTSSTVVRIEGTASLARVGQGLANTLDLDADGSDEVMGSYKSGTAIYLWLLYGDTTLTGTQTTASVDARFSVTGTDTTMVENFPSGGADFDNDGVDDFLFCNASGGDGYGEAWVLWGQSGAQYENATSEVFDTVATTIATGTAALGAGFVCGTAGDWDDDGAADLWIYDYDETDFYLVAGSAGLRSGAVDLEADALALYSFDTITNDPIQLRDMGNLDGDAGNAHEMGVTLSALDPSPSTVPGQLFIFGNDVGFGDVSSPSVEYSSQALFWGDDEIEAETFGHSLAGRASDVTDETNKADVVVADPEDDGGHGAVFVYRNITE